MFFGKRKNVVAVVRAIQQKACVYRFTPCDCKYARNERDTVAVLGATESGNGCPELRCAVALIEHMTDQEYEKLARRANRAINRAANKAKVVAALKPKVSGNKPVRLPTRRIQRCPERNGRLRCHKFKGHTGRHEFWKR